MRPQYTDHVWAYDFVTAPTHDHCPFRMLTLVDEFSRECLAIDVARKLKSDDVLERLAWLFATRGVPEHIRSDNGSEFTSKEVRQWLAKMGEKTLFIEPGSPWENGYVESFNGKLRHELLNGEVFYTLKEAKVLVERWRIHYNTVRPHSALGYRPPAPEAVRVKGLNGMIGLATMLSTPVEPCSAPLRRPQLEWHLSTRGTQRRELFLELLSKFLGLQHLRGRGRDDDGWPRRRVVLLVGPVGPRLGSAAADRYQ
ncbi:MAG: transposase family protein [Planctomycetes bacterium]|nr:transposase family protein [Planctomycetota bacterium]